MEEFTQYDVARLKSFRNNPLVKDNIKIDQKKKVTSLQFKFINYFNYSIGKLENLLELNDLIAFYESSNINQFKLLVNKEDIGTNNIVRKSKKFASCKLIAKTIFTNSENLKQYHNPEISYIKVNENNLIFFIQTYLKCFEAENRHSTSVHENFRQKLLIPHNEFHIIRFEEKSVGICGSYHKDDFGFLSVGGLLPEFRQLGLHKSSIYYRISKSLQKSPEEKIYSWAYDESVSFKNMLKVGMKLEKKFVEYEFIK